MSLFRLNATVEHWPLSAPFLITGHRFETIAILAVEIEGNGVKGRGEASGVYYHDDRPAGMLAQLERVRPAIEAGITRAELATLLPRGGARNALDCALWDWEAKHSGMAAWERAGLPPPRPLITTFGCGADTPGKMAAAARNYSEAQAIKLKLTGEPVDAERVRAVRDARPDVWLSVDANQGFTQPSFDALLPALVQADVALVEQPFPIGCEHWLDDLDCPIAIAADESVLDRSDLPALAGRFTHANIKLDKCGGLTEALAMVQSARALGIALMVGNMFGTSLGMAPACLVGQSCEVVDLDGPLFFRADRRCAASYSDGLISCPPALWGGVEISPDKADD